MRLPALLLASLAFVTPASAADCPPGAPSCKVITLTPDEERVLTGPNQVLDTAQQGRPLDLAQIVMYFRSKIATAPAGEVSKPAPAPATSPAPPAPAGAKQ